jgi:Lipid A core - O-antigen ligase and related enzymes
MLYFLVLLYISLMYIRPAEIFSQWATFPFADVVGGIAGFVGVVSLMLKPRPVVDLPQDKFLLAFWSLIFLSTVTVWFQLAYEGWLAFMPVVFCYFLIRVGIRTHSQFRGVIYLLIALNVFQAANGIVQYHTGIGLGDVPMIMDRIYGTGIFNDPNDLGMTFVMAVPLVLAVALNRAGRFVNRVLFLLALAAILVALYYTNSRGAVVGLAAALVCYSFLSLKRMTGFVVAAVLVTVVVVAAPARSTQIDYEESSAQGRIQAWAEGLAMLKANPVLGVGYGQYMEFAPVVAHNSFVHTLAELGLLGGFCLVGMFYWYFVDLRKETLQTTEAKRWRTALVSSGVGILTCSWFLSRQYVVVPYILLAVGTSWAVLNTKPGDMPKLKTTGRDVFNIGALTIGGLTVVYVSVRTLAIWSGG